MMSSVKTPFRGLALMLAATAAAACASTAGANGPDAELARAMEEALRPASEEERIAANRADPLTRANFWSNEYEKDPRDAKVTVEFAQALRGIGSEARALEVLATALVLHPSDPDVLMMIGRVRMSTGEHEAARTAFERVTLLAPHRADGWAAYGTALDQLDLHRQAQAAYQRALSIEPERTTTLTNYGLSLALSGDLSGAEQQLRAAAAKQDAGPRVQENLALVLGLQGQFEEMKKVSGAGAPVHVAEENAALLRAMVSPARSYESLTTAEDEPASSGGRRLRGTLN